jgi:phosphatidylinositol alpha 1,6-mannosyltransferase
MLDYEPVDTFLTEVMDPFKEMMWENTVDFLNKCELVLAPPAMVDTLRQKGLKAKMNVFSRGVDSSIFNPRRKDNAKLRVFYAGRLSDADHNIFEIARILSGFDGVETVVAGDGPDEEEFKEMMPGNTRFLGKVPHGVVGEEMGKADLVIVASTQHTHGNIYYEAIASGAVLLAKASKATTEVTGEHGDLGFVKVYKSVKEARDFLETVLEDREGLRTMQEGAAEYASKTFTDWDTVFREQMFRSIELAQAGFKKNLTTPGVLRSVWYRNSKKAS